MAKNGREGLIHSSFEVRPNRGYGVNVTDTFCCLAIACFWFDQAGNNLNLASSQGSCKALLPRRSSQTAAAQAKTRQNQGNSINIKSSALSADDPCLF